MPIEIDPTQIARTLGIRIQPLWKAEPPDGLRTCFPWDDAGWPIEPDGVRYLTIHQVHARSDVPIGKLLKAWKGFIVREGLGALLAAADAAVADADRQINLDVTIEP